MVSTNGVQEGHTSLALARSRSGPPVVFEKKATIDSRDPVGSNGFDPRRDNGNAQAERGPNAGLRALIADCNTQIPDRPKNATELGTSLVRLLLPYNARVTQRSVAKIHDRMKALESKMSDDSSKKEHIERQLKHVSEQLVSLRSLVERSSNGTAPAQTQSQNQTQTEVEAEEEEEALRPDARKLQDDLLAVNSQIISTAAMHVDKLRPIREDIQDVFAKIKSHSAKVAHSAAKLKTLETGQPGMSPSGAETGQPLNGGRSREAKDLATRQAAPIPSSNPPKRREPKSAVLEEDSPDTESPAGVSRIPEDQGRSSARLDDDLTSQPQATGGSNLKRKRFALGEEEPQSSKSRNVEPQKVMDEEKHGGLARRAAFIEHLKQFRHKYEADKPGTVRAEKDFVWSFIDEMEDKEFSAIIQRLILKEFPEKAVKSKGRGKPHRQIIIHGPLEWYQLVEAIKHMEVPDFCRKRN